MKTIFSESNIKKEEFILSKYFAKWYNESNTNGVLDVLKDEKGIITQEDKNKLWVATMLIFQHCTAKYIDIPSSIRTDIKEKLDVFKKKRNDTIDLIVEEILNFLATQKRYSESKIYNLMSFYKVQGFVMLNPESISEDIEASAKQLCEIITTQNIDVLE